MPENRISQGKQAACEHLGRALAAGVLSGEDTAALFYDLDALDRRFAKVTAAFPAGTLHAAAVKAAPFHALLTRLAGLGAGMEAASLPELEMALASGCPPSRVVFDSPAKTVSELRRALELGVHLNADNFQELERLDGLVGDALPKGSIGLRVNPQVGLGAIEATSVAGDYSKFGEPVMKRREIIDAYARRPWLTGLHMHVGSQGCGVELFTRAARIILELKAEINSACGCEQVRRVDIGGGLPVDYSAQESAPSMAAYARALREACPELFDGSLQVFTEFGRWLFANNGFAASRVEYVKEQPGHRTAVIHLGADMFLRTAYVPGVWRHEIAVANPEGSLKSGPEGPWHVAGPLCFSGDFLAKALPLPDLAPGDFLLVLDAGAYTYSMWSRYNSRQAPKVIGMENGAPRVLKERESVARVMEFWR